MSLTAARRATLAALADSLLPHGGALEPGASDVNVAGQLDSYLDRCAPGTRRKVERDPGIVPLEVTKPDKGFFEATDVVVVGSGAGGAVAAKELAERGLKVIVLEEGEHFDRRDFTGPPPERLRRFYRGNGLTFTIGVPTVSLPIGRGIGGSTLINSGTCFRTPGFVLESWGLDGAVLDPLFDEVEATLNVGPVGDDIMGANGEAMDRGRRGLGYSGGPIRRSANGW